MGSQLLKFYKLQNLKVLLTDSLDNFRTPHPTPALIYCYVLDLFILLYECCACVHVP